MKNVKWTNTKGVSLPLITGLVSLLMVSSVAVNELIIRNLRSIQRIEASNRAYLAAEGGVEDALYELTPHFAGYKTPALTNTTVREIDFENKGKCDSGDFCDKWAIESRSGQNTWSGRLYANQKLTLALYNDVSNLAAPTIPINGIYDYTYDSNDITAFNVADFSITFSIPDDITTSWLGGLAIDNDEDVGITVLSSGLNEDSIGVPLVPTCVKNPADNDCDGQTDEDSLADAVILWKLTDGGSLSLIPIRGCLEAPVGNPTLPQGSDPCEYDFGASATPEPYSVTLDFSDLGENEAGEQETIGDFIGRAINGAVSPPTPGNLNAKIQFEFLIVAPMEHTDISTLKKYEIPYIEYEVNSALEDQIPYPQFTIKSDGYYRGFKQSITSTVSPKTTVPLFDFTIIQQE